MAGTYNPDRPSAARRAVPTAYIEGAAVVLTLAVVLWAWEWFAELKQLPAFFLPRPSVIGARLVRALADGTLTYHTGITWAEALTAFFLALVFATVLGYALAKSPLLEKVVSPYIVASQSLPIFAIAPFVLIWLGNGFVANVVMGALVAFFPMLINTIVSVRSVSAEQRDILRSFGATGWQTLLKLELPAALPVLFGGMRVGITLSVIGVLVVELFWADRGLGFLLNFAQRQFDTPLLFVGIVALLVMNLTMYLALALLQRIVMPWRHLRDAAS